MARNDQWCDLCDDKLKSTTVTRGPLTLEVCGHCASMYYDSMKGGATKNAEAEN